MVLFVDCALVDCGVQKSDGRIDDGWEGRQKNDCDRFVILIDCDCARTRGKNCKKKKIFYAIIIDGNLLTSSDLLIIPVHYPCCHT